MFSNIKVASPLNPLTIMIEINKDIQPFNSTSLLINTKPIIIRKFIKRRYVPMVIHSIGNERILKARCEIALAKLMIIRKGKTVLLVLNLIHPDIEKIG